MIKLHRQIVWFLMALAFSATAQSQCDASFDPSLSKRVANYEIDARLDTRAKTITATETVTWTNPSTDTVRELRFYMYMNAFSNTESSFLRESEDLFGRDFRDLHEEEWGYIDVTRLFVDSTDLLQKTTYIQPDDQNTFDRTVLKVALDQPVEPGRSVKVDLSFTTKLPAIMVRAGYSRDDFYHAVHWFPQVGVLERGNGGEWQWNCHQFHRWTEFYSDFGTYRVRIEAPDHLTIDGSGCKVTESRPEAGWQEVEFYVEDVIDFAWVAYPYFESFYDEWNGVEIRLHTAEEHGNLAPRFLEAVKAALAYLEEHVGPYPYPSITMMDPPLHALSAGFMEYPTYITLGSFRYFPKNVRSLESLVVHEFTHQYFMAMVASNEKEEPWLDEGFVTYFEDRIMEATYGENSSLIDLFGYRMSNSDLTRTEYIDLPDPSIAPISRPAWEYKTSYKGLVYSKSATILKTMEGLLGRPLMDTVIRTYFDRWKFAHPRGQDFYKIVEEVVGNSSKPGALGDIDRFFDQLIYGTGTCDYAVDDIVNNELAGRVGLFESGGERSFESGNGEGVIRGSVTVRRMGDVILPVDVLVTFEDGSTTKWIWSGEETFRIFHFDKKVRSCSIDPERKVMLDVNMLNNGLTLEKNPWPIRKIGAKSMFWIQNLLQSFAFLV